MTVRESKAMRRAGKYADDILEAIRRIERYTQHYDFNEFLPADEADELKAIVVEHCLEKLSDASRRLPDSLKAAEQDIDWRSFASLADHLWADGRRTDARLIREVCVKELPALKLAVERIKSRL